MLEISVLGAVELRGPVPVVVDQQLQRALATRLALAGGNAVPDERLARDLWGEEELSRPTERLRVVAFRLRSALGAAASALSRSPAGYALAAATPDLAAAEGAASRVRQAVRSGDPRTVHAAATEALGHWRGPALADLRTYPFAAAEGDRLDALQLELQVELLDAGVELDRATVADAERLAGAHPLHERLTCLLALALYRSGRQADALDRITQLKQRLAEELGVDPTPETAAMELRLLQQDPALAGTPPTPVRTELPATHLRPLPTTFVGRIAERGALLDQLRGPGLITLIGIAGSGKTRLATEIALATQAAGRPLALVDLTVVRDPEAVVPALALAVGVEPETADPIAACAQLLTGALLIIDNAEHIVDAVAAMVSRLLRHNPELAVLVTSQRPLLLAGEELHQIGPLSPSAAAELFCQRSGVRRDANVDAICTAVDRLPLGIELAAGLTRTLTVPQLAARISDRTGLLIGGGRDSGARHTSLRAALDWSYDLLDPSVRAVLRRLAVFSGGCTLEAAEAVAAQDGTNVAAAITELVDRCLLIIDVVDDVRRFGLLETVRDYGLHLIRAAGEETELKDRHLAYFSDFAADLDRPEGQDQGGLLIREWSNIVAALEYAPGSRLMAKGLRLAIAVDDIWIERGTPHQAIRHYSALVDAEGASDEHRARLLSNYAYACAMTGRISQAAELLDRAEPLARAAGDKYLVMRVLFHRGVAEIEGGRPLLALEVLERGRPIAEEHGAISTAAYIDAIGTAHLYTGALDEAMSHIAAGKAMTLELDAEQNFAHDLAREANVLLARGETAAAMERADELRPYSDSRDDLDAKRDVWAIYGSVALVRGDLDGAIGHFRTALRAEDHGADAELVRVRLVDALLEAGLVAEARAELAGMRLDDQGLTWLAAQPAVAELALLDGDADGAVALVDQAESEFAKRGFGWPPVIDRLAEVRAKLSTRLP